MAASQDGWGDILLRDDVDPIRMGISYIWNLRAQFKQIFWETVKFAGVVATPVAWLIFAFEYTGRKAWINARRLAMLSIVPLVTFLIILTNDAHGLFRIKRELSFEGGFLLLRTTDGTWFWVHAAYTYILIMVGLALIVRALLGPHNIGQMVGYCSRR
jgi:hypothetical protein